MCGTKIKQNESVGKTHKFACVGSCNNSTNHEVIKSIQTSGVTEYHSHWYVNYEIVKCLGCENVSFREESSNSDEYYGETDICVVKELLYPKRESGRTKLAWYSMYLPIELRDIYAETDAAMDNKLLILAGVGMRAILETVCKDQKAVGKDLYIKIDGLVKVGVLTTNGAKILHNVRAIGNVSAHEVKPQPQDQLDLAWEVIINLLNSVYILPKRASQVFKK
ncbi:MAG: DUF4145 domain-containing protein [Rhizobiaceae bacterium]